MPIPIIGTTTHPRNKQHFGIKPADLRQHLYCLGKTGTGKTTLLRNLIVQDIEAGRGLALIDPHGELAEVVLEHIPRHRTRDVIYFDPSDLSYPVGFNVLRSVPLDSRHLVASHVVSSFKAIWRSSWGPRLQYILFNTCSALLDTPGATLLGILRMLTDSAYRAHVEKHITDPLVREFWRTSGELRPDVISPIVNKVGQLLASPPIRNVLGQKQSTFDPRLTMDRGQIFIARLPKGALGDEQANLLGSLIISFFGLAAMGRADTPEHLRRDFTLYVDEFHSYTTERFATMLSESRKYRLGLVLAHQYLDQLRIPVRTAVFGNVGTMVSFRVGKADGNILAAEFGESVGLHGQDFASLPPYNFYVRLLIDGAPTNAFSAETIPPTEVGTRHLRGAQIRRFSRERFGVPREKIEREIARWYAA